MKYLLYLLAMALAVAVSNPVFADVDPTDRGPGEQVMADPTEDSDAPPWETYGIDSGAIGPIISLSGERKVSTVAICDKCEIKIGVAAQTQPFSKENTMMTKTGDFGSGGGPVKKVSRMALASAS